MAPLKPALLIVFVVVAVISGESATYSYYHSTTGACARVPGLRRGGEEGGGERGVRGKGEERGRGGRASARKCALGCGSV